MSFRVRDVRLAVPVRKGMEVLPRTALVPDSEAPVPLLGVASGQEGQVAVLDLAALLEIGGETDGGWILVVSAGARCFGLLVDEVSGLLPVVLKAIQPLPKGLWASDTEHLVGLYPLAPAADDAAHETDEEADAETEEDASEQEAPIHGWLTLLDVDSLLRGASATE